ncbi:hypothetical protein EI94DRAFT_1756475 [Lactarius quietus]|nr:hypothetical protein EI94DRAFT_1756475 [Lactarius quietus]
MRILVREHRCGPPGVDELRAGLTGMLASLPEPTGDGKARGMGTRKQGALVQTSECRTGAKCKSKR